MKKEKELKTNVGLEKQLNQVSRFEFRDVNISDIQYVSGAQRYIDQTDSNYPFILNTPKGDFVYDGHDLVEEAKHSGAETIRAFVHIVDEHDDALIELLNLGNRTKTPGGKVRIAETILRLRNCKKHLEDAGENITRYSHGGNRRGASFTNDNVQNIRIILENYSGLKRSSINEYLANAEGIDDETLLKLANGILQPSKDKSVTDSRLIHATKNFCRNIQKNKTESIMKLESDGVSQDEIFKIISSKVFAAFNEDTTGKNVTVFDEILGQVSKPDKSKQPVKSVAEDILDSIIGEGSGEVESSKSKTDIQSSNKTDEESIAPASSEPMHVSRIREIGQYLISLADSGSNEMDMAERIEAVIVSLTEAVVVLRKLDDDRLAA